MASPRRRVFARSVALSLCRVENRLNATTYSGRGFRLFHPNGLQHGEDSHRVNFVNRPGSKRGGVDAKRSFPLLLMFWVAPLG